MARPGDRRRPGPHLPAPDSEPNPDAEPALYVHGLGGASTNFTDLADLLSPYLAGEALDLPGFGRSGPSPEREYSIAAHTRLVIRYLEQAERGPVHLVGNSMGGAISIQVAATRPDLVRTLTLVSPAVPDIRPHKSSDLLVPLMLMPGIGMRALARLEGYPPERRAQAVIELCFAHPELVPPNRLAEAAEEVTYRRDLAGPARPSSAPSAASPAATPRTDGAHRGGSCAASRPRPWWFGVTGTSSSTSRTRPRWRRPSRTRRCWCSTTSVTPPSSRIRSVRRAVLALIARSRSTGAHRRPGRPDRPAPNDPPEQSGAAIVARWNGESTERTVAAAAARSITAARPPSGPARAGADADARTTLAPIRPTLRLARLRPARPGRGHGAGAVHDQQPEGPPGDRRHGPEDLQRRRHSLRRPRPRTGS